MRRFVLFTAILLAGCLASPRAQKTGLPGSPRSAASRIVRVAIPDGQGDSVVLDHNENRAWRSDATGRALWSSPLDGELGLVRPPHLLADENRVYITHADGVTALDAATGSVAWHSPGAAECMHLSGELLLATECGISDRITKTGRWVIARSALTGTEVFRVAVPTDNFNACPIKSVADLFLVQALKGPSDPTIALLIDRNGRIRHRFNRQVVTVVQRAEGYLVLTSRDVVFLSQRGTVKWSVPFDKDDWLVSGGVIGLADRNVVAFRYCPISDTGVNVMLLDAERGVKHWETRTCCFGVAHSGYNLTAEITETDGLLTVTSQGSGGFGSSGTLVEVLDTNTGRTVSVKKLGKE